MINEKSKEIEKIDAYFRATNYLSVCQLYLYDNPLLRRPLELKDIKPRLVGHWGTAPGQNFIYVHLNRIIKKYDLNMIYISGPGHGGQAMIANTYLEGSYTRIYPEITEDEEGLRKLCRQFSFPGGVSSHVAPETPGSINEGGELGYSLSHAFGAVLDNPTLIAACVVGDGEAETGPLAASWNGNKFLNPKTDGVVLPILHLNGYKIANPTIMGRMSDKELTNHFSGLRWEPFIVNCDDSMKAHAKMMKTLDVVIRKINKIKNSFQDKDIVWPMIILKTPKGWTGPKIVDDKIIEGSFRAHQVPIVIDEEHPEKLTILENWLKSYHPEELFDENGKLINVLRDLAPETSKSMGMNPNANGGLLLKELALPEIRKYGLNVVEPGKINASDMMELGHYVRDLIMLNPENFKIFGPDEALSNRLNHVFESTTRKWNSKILPGDDYLSSVGSVIDSVLSEHLCEGMLEGYLLTGRHGVFNSYEAFIRVVDSMIGQHAKWLKMSKELPWRKNISSLNCILTSHTWQQDHNGYTHQEPGFLNHIANKKSSMTRIYLPADANCLIATFDKCMKTDSCINTIVASKHLRPQWLSMEDAIEHCTKGIGEWKFASYSGNDPDVVMACAGDTPTLEVLAAISILKEYLPSLKVRFINVVDLMKLAPSKEHPHGLTDDEYNNLFTKDKPIIFAFHGYPSLIHQLTYKRYNRNLDVHGYQEEGTITTPFDMRVQNKIDRFNLILSVLDKIPEDQGTITLRNYCNNKLEAHHSYIRTYGKDMDDIDKWTWSK